MAPLLLADRADASFDKFASSVKHIACDRTDAAAMKQHLANKGFEGEGGQRSPCFYEGL